MPEQKIIYYPDSNDDMWNQECEALIPYLFGEGADIGSSVRSIFENDVRVDIDKERNPTVRCSGDELPFNDNTLDYLYSIHSFEHFEDQKKTIQEWTRVIKRGGIIGIVHPDVEFTGIQLPIDLNKDKNPYNKHTFERTYQEFLKWLKINNYFGLKLIDSGIACGKWSFFVILKKKGCVK